MSIVIKFFKETFRLFIERNLSEKNDIYRLLYFPLVYGVAYCIGSLLVVVRIFETFFRPFDVYWSINFAHWAVESSHNFYTIFKNSLRIAASITIGAIVSYTSLSIVGRSVWPNCFIFLVYTFLATGPMMSSTLLPFSFGKFMFISYYFLTFTEVELRSNYYSPIIHLKFVLASYISIGTCTLTCIIFRMKFGSGLFIKTTVNIFQEIKAYIRASQKQLNLIVLNKSGNKQIEKRVVKEHQQELLKKNQLDKDLEMNNQYDNDDKLNSCKYSSSSSSSSNKKKKSIIHYPIHSKPPNIYKNKQKQLQPQQQTQLKHQNHHNIHKPYHSQVHNHNHNHLYNHLHNNRHSNKNNNNNNIRYKQFFIMHKHYKKKLEFHYYEYSRQLNQLNLYLNDSRKESFGRESLVYHYEKIQILLERNHKKLFAIGFGLRQDCTLGVSKKLAPILPLLNQLITETENIFNTMELQLKKKYIHSNNHEFSKWFKEQHELYYINDEKYEEDSEKIDFKVNSNIPFKIDQLEVVLNMNNKNDYIPNTLEWHQNQINQAFKRIDAIIERVEQTFITIFHDKVLFNPHQDNSISKIFYSVAGFKSFSIEQKFLSKQVFLVSYHLSIFRFQPREFRFIKNVFRNLKYLVLNLLNISNNSNSIKNISDNSNNCNNNNNSISSISSNQIQQQKDKEFIDTIKLNKLQLYINCLKSIIVNRIFFNWVFSLKYALVTSILTISIFEIQKHSDFILFDRLAWLLDTYILVSQPDIGAIAFVSTMRIIGTMIGGSMAYTCVVLCKLGHSSVSEGFIYVGFSFFTITLVSFLVQGQPFDTMLQIIVFTYSVISVPQFYARQEDIIYALFKVLYVTLGVILVLIVSMIVPYFDFRQLEKNLFRIPNAIIDMVDYLMEYSFDFHNNNLVQMDDSDNITSANPTKLESINDNNSISNNNNNININNNNNNNNKPISFREYRILIGKKYIKLRKIFPAQRRLLIDSGFELIFQYGKYKRIEHILKSIEELHNLFGALEFMIIQSNDQSKMRSIGSTVTKENRSLMEDLQFTSKLLSKLPPEKDNVGFTKSISSQLQLSVAKDNSIELCDKLIIHLNRVLTNNYSKLSIIQFHRINAILYSLYCFVDQYHHVFNSLVGYKNVEVVNKLNNNNYRNTNNEKDIRDQLNILN